MAIDDPDSPALEDVLLDTIRGELARAHVGLPARVVSYDRTTQTAVVQPVIRGRYRTPEGESATYRMPQIAGVPVAFPAGGGFSITWDLAVDDEVLLAICERSLDEWKAQGGDDVTARDRRRFDLSDAVAIPGLRSPGSPLVQVQDGAMVIAGAEIRIGSRTAAQAFVLGTAFKILYNAHVHPSPFGPTGFPAEPMDAAPGTHLSLKIKGE